jgi:hypothetical protein
VQYLYDHACHAQEAHVRVFRNAASIAVLGVALTASAARAQAALQYRWKQGDVLVYKTTLKTTSTMSGIPGQDDVSLEQTMTQRIRLLAAAVAPDGSVTLHQTTEAVSVEMDTPMGKVAFDSADPKSADQDEAARALGKVFGGMVGSTISVSMSPLGAVQRIDGIQKVIDKITQDLGAGRGGSSMATGLRSVLSEEAVRASLEQSFPRLPPQPVKPGDTWTGHIALGSDLIGRIGGTQTFTFKGIDGADATGFATITVALALKQESTPPVGPSGMTVKMGESKGDGEIEFDVTNGRIRKSTMKTEMPSTMSTVGPDGRAAQFKQTTKTSMTMALVEK